MATRFETRSTYEAPAAALIELYSDPAFHEAKARAMGATRARCTRSQDADGTVVVTLQTMRPARWAPGGKDRSTFILRIDTADGAGAWERIQRGFEDKARARGTTRIVTAGAGRSTVEVEGEIEIRVPLVGGALERRIVAGLDHETEREAAFVRSQLTRRHL